MRLLELFENDPQNNPNFRSWFGDSKAVTDSGEPKVVYHGTIHDVLGFDPRAEGIEGIFFSDHPYIASDYATPYRHQKKMGGQVYPVYLSIQHPLIIDYGAFLRNKFKPEDLTPEDEQNEFDADIINELVYDAKRSGYDGVILKNIRDGWGLGSPLGTTYVVFDPKQIKSIFNVGTYGKHTDRISEASRWSETAKGRTLYHGTTLESAQSALEHGLWPSVGEFVSWAYEEDPELPAPELLDLAFAADKRNILSAINAMIFQVQKKLRGGTWLSFNERIEPITPEELLQHGAILVLREGELRMAHADPDKMRSGKIDPPPQVEPGDWYTHDDVEADYIITGNKLRSFMKRFKAWPLEHPGIDWTKHRTMGKRPQKRNDASTRKPIYIDQPTNEAVLMELQKRWEPQGEKPERVVAFRGKYWLLPTHDEIPIEVAKDIAASIGMNNPDVFKNEDDAIGFMEQIYELGMERPDIIVGNIDENGDLIIGREAAHSHHPVTSSLLRKLVHDLRADGIWVGQLLGIEGMEDFYYPKEIMKGDLPDYLFHGTNSDYLRQIARVGLRPGRVKSNWAEMGIHHSKLIFGAASYEDVVFHANRSAGFEDIDPHAYGQHIDPDEPFPVIIKFKIPDKNLLVPDYDVASAVIGTDQTTSRIGYSQQPGYSNPFRDEAVQMYKRLHPEGRYWKGTGIYGYKGWIPPNHIVTVYTNFFTTDPLGRAPYWEGSLNEFFQQWERMEEELWGNEDEEL